MFTNKIGLIAVSYLAGSDGVVFLFFFLTGKSTNQQNLNKTSGLKVRTFLLNQIVWITIFSDDSCQPQG